MSFGGLMRYKAQTNNNNKITKLIAKLQVAVCLVLFFSPLVAHGTSLEQKIQETKEVLGSLDTQKKTLNSEVATLDNQIYQAQLKIDSTQGELAATKNQIEETKQEISQAEENIAKQKIIMNEYLRTMYVEGQVSTIELIAKSRNFSDFVDQSEYLGAMQQNVQETADNIIALKLTLDQKNKTLEISLAKTQSMLNEQVSGKQLIDNQRAVRDSLLAQTKGDEGKYQVILASLYEERRLASIQTGQTSGGQGGTRGYNPSNWGNNSIDPWKFYTYQCTSYAAWYSASHGGPVPASVLQDWGSGHIANGGNWASLARGHSIAVDNSPTVGSIAVWPIGSLTSPNYSDGYGHVAIVTGVSGSTISVSEYNFLNPEAYGTRGNVPINWVNTYTGGSYSLSFIH